MKTKMKNRAELYNNKVDQVWEKYNIIKDNAKLALFNNNLDLAFKIIYNKDDRKEWQPKNFADLYRMISIKYQEELNNELNLLDALHEKSELDIISRPLKSVKVL